MKVTFNEARMLLKDIARATFSKKPKAPENQVTVQGKLSQYTTKLLQPYKNDMEKLCATYKKPLVLAQKGNTLLINTGAYTSSLNLEELEDPSKSIMSSILDNFHANRHLNIKG